MAKKKRRQPDSAAETLDAIESWGDRLAQRISDNPTPILGAAVGVLVVAAAVGLTRDFSSSGHAESAAALAKAQSTYRTSMGASPNGVEIPEPANPETAREARSQAIVRFEAVATEYPETPASSLALLEAGRLQQELEAYEAAQATIERALADVRGNPSTRALLLSRLAAIYEASGRLPEAAETYAEVGRIREYPLRFDALSDSARTYAQAGDSQSAVATYDLIKTEDPDYVVPAYIEARILELRSDPAD